MKNLNPSEIEYIQGGISQQCWCVEDMIGSTIESNKEIRSCNTPTSMKCVPYETGQYTDIEVTWTGLTCDPIRCMTICCNMLNSMRWLWGKTVGNFCRIS